MNFPDFASILVKNLLFPPDHLIDPADILFYFLYILAALSAVFRREHHFCGGSGAAGDDRANSSMIKILYRHAFPGRE